MQWSILRAQPILKNKIVQEYNWAKVEMFSSKISLSKPAQKPANPKVSRAKAKTGSEKATISYHHNTQTDFRILNSLDRWILR